MAGPRGLATCEHLPARATATSGCASFFFSKVPQVDPITRTNHGMRKHALYGVWASMITRCGNPHCKAFGDYGGRGIRVCERWRHNFSTFLEDMGERPSNEHVLDRINNDGNYEPGNVRWATRAQSAKNRRPARKPRRARFLTFNGRTMYVKQWADKLGIAHGALIRRLCLGWSVERVLSTPIRS